MSDYESRLLYAILDHFRLKPIEVDCKKCGGTGRIENYGCNTACLACFRGRVMKLAQIPDKPYLHKGGGTKIVPSMATAEEIQQPQPLDVSDLLCEQCGLRMHHKSVCESCWNNKEDEEE